MLWVSSFKKEHSNLLSMYGVRDRRVIVTEELGPGDLKVKVVPFAAQ